LKDEVISEKITLFKYCPDRKENILILNDLWLASYLFNSFKSSNHFNISYNYKESKHYFSLN